MLHHIEYCLDEIECEIDSHLGAKISEADGATLKDKLAEIRAILASSPVVEIAKDSTEFALTTDRMNIGLVADEAGITGIADITEPMDAPVEIVELIAETTAITETNEIADVSEFTAIVANLADNLLLIRGIDPGTAALLSDKGVTFAAIADWRAVDIADLALEARRVAQQGWIEQAAVLATGRLTHYAARVERGELACLVAQAGETATADLETVCDLRSDAETETPAAAEASDETLAPTLIVSSSYLPPVFDGTCPAKVEDKAEIEPAKAEIVASKDETNAETVAAAASNVIALTPRNRDHTWLRRASLAASLLLLMSVGILGMQHKLPSTSAIQQIVSVD